MERSYNEIYEADILFEKFRNVNLDLDWIKFQVYGKKCIPEMFPSQIPTLEELIKKFKNQKI